MARSGVIVIDPVKVQEHGGMAVKQLARLSNAIMLQQRLGVYFDRSIKIEVGEAVAILTKCVTEVSDDQQTETDTERHGSHGEPEHLSGGASVQSAAGRSGVARKGSAKAGPSVRLKRKPADPGKSAKGEG